MKGRVVSKLDSRGSVLAARSDRQEFLATMLSWLFTMTALARYANRKPEVQSAYYARSACGLGSIVFRTSDKVPSG